MALKDVLGQEKAINILRGAISRNRTPSSYLFAGESGIGKKLTAINLAKVLNCQNIALESRSEEAQKSKPPNFSPQASRRGDRTSELEIDCCDECPACRKIEAQTHPDFLMITPEKGEIRIEEIRAVEEVLSFAPYEGKCKVVIIDDAETMNSAAANAFLKTLEEPPPQSTIILISSSPDRLPETIRSRCSRINFLLLSPKKCEEVIKTVIGDNPSVVSQVMILARLSMGRPGLAVSNDLIEEREWFLRLIKEMFSSGNKEAWTDKEEIEKWINSAFVVLRDLAVFKITGGLDLLINSDLKDKIADMSKTVELKDIIESYTKLSFLKGYLGFNLNKAITWNYTGLILKKLKRGFSNV